MGGAQCFLLAQCSGVTPEGALGIVYSAGDQTGITKCVRQMPELLLSLFLPLRITALLAASLCMGSPIYCPVFGREAGSVILFVAIFLIPGGALAVRGTRETFVQWIIR